MHPITAQIRSVPSVSSLFNDDFTWSMGTSQAPTAGVAVLRRFSCLWRQRQRGVHRQQQQWAGFSGALMNDSHIGGTLMQSNKHRLTAQKTRTWGNFCFTHSHIHDSSCFCYCFSFLFPFCIPCWNHTVWNVHHWLNPTEVLHVMKDFC